MMNVSTTAGLVSAAAKIKIAKHGNRTATGKSGSADVLEAADVNLSLSPNQVAKCIEEIGIGFMFAQNFHPGMKFVMPVENELLIKLFLICLDHLPILQVQKDNVLGFMILNGFCLLQKL